MPAQLACEGDKGIQIVYGEENYFLYWAHWSIQDRTKITLPARQAQRTNQGRSPFIKTLWVPFHLSFHSQQGPNISGSIQTRRDWIGQKNHLTLQSLWSYWRRSEPKRRYYSFGRFCALPIEHAPSCLYPLENPRWRILSRIRRKYRLFPRWHWYYAHISNHVVHPGFCIVVCTMKITLTTNACFLMRVLLTTYQNYTLWFVQ